MRTWWPVHSGVAAAIEVVACWGRRLGGRGERGNRMNKVYQAVGRRVRRGYVAVLAAAAVTGGMVPVMAAYPVPVDPDYRLIENTDANSDGKYTVGQDGKVVLKVKDDASGTVKPVEVNGVAVVYGPNKTLRSTDSRVAWNEVKGNSAARDTTTSITLGKNTHVSVQGGYTERSFFGIPFRAPSKGESILFGDSQHTGGIAIGENVKSLNASTVVGINGYRGKLGNVDLKSYNPVEPLGVASTSVGSNSFVSGTFTSNVGAYNISSTDYLNGNNGFLNSNAFQNFGSVMMGSLNSIESRGTGESTAGNANGLIGIANRAQNSNGSLIFGTGNEITNSIQDISMFSDTFTAPASAAAAADSVREAVQGGKAGGAVLAMGGGNKADHTTLSQLMGVQNVVNGSTLTMATGYRNKVENSHHVSVIGTDNTVSGNSNVVLGDNHALQGENNIVLGAADDKMETHASGAVVLGHNANVTQDGGVALGENSVASVAAGKVGYLAEAGAEDAVWKSKAAAVSVGTGEMTRQITHVAAGTEDTDAVNVAQLKRVTTALGAGWNLSTNGRAAVNVAPGQAVDVSPADSNVVISQEGTNVKVGLARDITAHSVTADEGKLGGVTVSPRDENHLSRVSGVAPGQVVAGSTDAVNGSQLYETNQMIQESQGHITQLTGSVNRLGNRIDRVGAGAAALAALHPLDFDPDAKWDFSAGYGHYNGANAVALGAYYRPNEDVMLSVGGSVGGGENMVNAGISLKIGTGASPVNNSKVAMAKEIKDLRKEVETLKSLMRDSHAGRAIDTSRLQLFPDVPQNHWAYEYVTRLAGHGMIQGYPDGTFGGSRPMTRYEFAALLYRAMTRGAVLSDRILTEFAPELERFTVDTIHVDKEGQPTVERVRVAKR